MALPHGCGKLRHRIDLQKPDGAPNSYGEKSVSYTTAVTVWASIDPTGGRKLMIAQQMQADAAHVIVCRHWPGVDPTWRARFRGRALNFVSVKNVDEKDEYLVIGTQEYQQLPP